MVIIIRDCMFYNFDRAKLKHVNVTLSVVDVDVTFDWKADEEEGFS